MSIAVKVSAEWGAEAAQAGWTAHELYGCNPDPLASRVDRNGLVTSLYRFLSPMKIATIDAEGAYIEDRNGVRLRFYRRERRGQSLLWEAYAAQAP